jgi:hypothetical protein
MKTISEMIVLEIFMEQNVAANHRASYVIVSEGCSQTLRARFMYGPLDMVALAGEKVDIYVMKITHRICRWHSGLDLNTMLFPAKDFLVTSSCHTGSHDSWSA